MPARLLRQYAAIFFFAPMVQFRLKHHNFGLSDGDHYAIRRSVSRGYVIFGLGLGFVVSSVAVTISDRVWLSWSYRGLMVATIIAIAVGIWQIHHPADIIPEGSTSLVTNTMLLSYLPGYNRYRWYTQQDPHHPYRWLKESILWWYLIMLCLIVPWLSGLGMLLIVLMIIRLVVLAAGYDLIPPQGKQRLNRHYTLHADECWAYVSAGIEALWSADSYQSIVTSHRHLYRRQLPRKIAHRGVVEYVSYGILLVLLVSLLWYVQSVTRYALMTPVVRWGYGLLICYAIIRWRTSGWSPIPVLHPVVAAVAHLIDRDSQ